MVKLKRFASIVFIALGISDVCSYVRYAITKESFKIRSFNIFYTRMQFKNIYNIAIIYFAVLSALYFIFNFFKKSNN